MYIPGRSRTGSSPSRTVMSLAVYVASLIEKALETGRFRALRILPEHTVGICLCEAQCGCFCDDFAKVLGLDLGRQILGLQTVLVGGLDGRSDPPCGRLERRFRKRSDGEPETRRSKRAEGRAHSLFELSELERPGRGARVHVQGAVAADARRPRVARDLRADRDRPGLDEQREPGCSSEASQLARDRIADPLHHNARTLPLDTSSSWDGSIGSADAVVEVTSVWPVVATRCASARRRSGSSS